METTDPASDHRPRTTLAMSPQVVDQVFPPALRDRLDEVADVRPGGALDEFESPEARTALAGTEVLLTCWGCPPVDARVLDRAPLLRAVVHAAGTVKPFVTEEVHARGIAVSTAADANAVPVAEFTLAAVILGAKRAFPLSRRMSAERTGRTGLGALPAMGTNGITVGVIGASRVGRRVLRLLACLDVRLLVHDPYLTDAETRELGALPAELDHLLAQSDVVTVHAPELPGTRHLLDTARLALLRDGALLVNTARGRLVDTEALTKELLSGRIDAVLDVTDPEPLPPDSPLYALPNVFLTPHLAGALGNELPRLGGSAVQEIARLGRGEPLAFPVTAREWEYTA